MTSPSAAKRGIERNKSIGSNGSDTAVVLLSELRMKAHEVRKSTDEDARSEGLRSPVGSPIHEVELPVSEKIEGRSVRW